jgi:hypothetical protein
MTARLRHVCAAVDINLYFHGALSATGTSFGKLLPSLPDDQIPDEIALYLSTI